MADLKTKQRYFLYREFVSYDYVSLISVKFLQIMSHNRNTFIGEKEKKLTASANQAIIKANMYSKTINCLQKLGLVQSIYEIIIVAHTDSMKQ